MKIINPSAIFGTAERLDAFIKAAYKTIEHYAKTEVDAEAEKAQLFAIRNAVGQRMKTGHMVQATYQLQPKLPLSMENAKGNHFATILLRNDSDGLLIEKPKDAFGDYIPFTRGSKITVFFYTGNHQGYQFKTKIQRTADSNGHLYLVLAHSQAISSLPSRQHERTTVRIPCRFFRVQVQVSGQGKSAKRLVHAENVPIAGMISDISAGGLSIQTVSPLHSAEFAKIVFDAGFGERSVFATIVRTNRLKNSFAMHVRFVKATRKTINELHALVFGYA
ncbi:MAG: hypothetical protein A2004_13975 [Spirochaetes bacterium GWC1_61_12]|nr:MAG: hypothetical protein A2004_13975 [Spirochaetes bacterium GWC1_61_12]OHD59495.1 MAG: hypothetical protein A2Y32_10260 [Spirochaetes bacterium GWF1_60_12]